jgi:hypothetical protein
MPSTSDPSSSAIDSPRLCLATFVMAVIVTSSGARMTSNHAVYNTRKLASRHASYCEGTKTLDRRQARPFVHGPVPLLVTEHSWPMEHRDAESDMPSSAVFVAQRVQASCFSERLWLGRVKSYRPCASSLVRSRALCSLPSLKPRRYARQPVPAGLLSPASPAVTGHSAYINSRYWN